MVDIKVFDWYLHRSPVAICSLYKNWLSIAQILPNLIHKKYIYEYMLKGEWDYDNDDIS